MTKTLPISEVRQNLTTLVDKANRLLDEYVITVNGKPAAILISADQYESLQETTEILSNKNLMKDLAEAEKEISSGEYVTLKQFKKTLKLDV